MLSVLSLTATTARRSLHSISRKPFKEVNIPVPWGKISGKWWGSTKIKPIICLHGLQDNCGSLEPLVTFLNKNDNFSFLGIDFPGHGYSSKFPRGVFYHFFTYPMIVKRICDHFKWPNVTLMGHSIGAVTSFAFTMLYPERVKFLICIDALHPFTTTVNAETLRRGIDLFIKYDDIMLLEDEPIAYTLEEAVQKIVIGYNNAIKTENVPLLLERNMRPSRKFPGKYYFSRDPKLKMKVMCDWPYNQVIKDAASITQPIFVCKARHNMYYGPKEHFYNVLDVLRKNSKDCDFQYEDGTHYLHFNDPDKIGARIRSFLDKHYEEEESGVDKNSYVFSEHPLNALKFR